MDGHKKDVFDAVEGAYRLHASGNTVNPDSYFLRNPDKPSARIIALPAHLGGAVQISGIKWISSFPENRASNLARASAVLILNDAATGYPVACIEALLISATRTGALRRWRQSTFLPIRLKEPSVSSERKSSPAHLRVASFRKWKFRKVSLYDADRNEAEQFSKWLREQHNLRADIEDRLEGALSDSSLILFTTTASKPYLADETLLKHAPTVLHLSLRDICVNVVLASQNIVDDVDHCLKVGTSLHLAETATGNRNFVSGTLVDVLEGKVKLDHDRPRIFSPFGLGVLDVAVGHFVLEAAKASGTAMALPDFFSNSARW